VTLRLIWGVAFVSGTAQGIYTRKMVT
jgi:hypothetical protein